MKTAEYSPSKLSLSTRINRLIKASNEPQIIMKHLVSALMDSLNAYDLEGIANLPDQMKPNPSQKPRQIINPKEKSEEVNHYHRYENLLLNSCNA